MNKVLYKDNEFELAIDNVGLYLCINEGRYELSCHPYEPCTYIKTIDGAVDIVMHNAFDLSFVVKDFEEGQKTNGGNVYGYISALEFCKIINTFIMKDKTLKKQRIARETGYKTASNFNGRLIKYYDGYFIYGETDRESWDKTIYTAIKYDENGDVYDTIQGNFVYCKTLTEIKQKVDEHLKYIGKSILFHDIECKVSSAYDNSHYRLIAMGGTYEQLQKDKSFTEYHEWGAIALPVTCPCCNKITWFDDTDIPNGEKYEILCDNCKVSIIRKK